VLVVFACRTGRRGALRKLKHANRWQLRGQRSKTGFHSEKRFDLRFRSSAQGSRALTRDLCRQGIILLKNKTGFRAAKQAAGIRAGPPASSQQGKQ
jgi:hypothetical protein